MKGIPLIETNDPALIARGYNLGLKLVANIPQVLTLKHLEYYERNLPELQEAIRRGFILPGELERRVEVILPQSPKPQPPDLTSTGPTFADWLEAREKLHEFLTGEKISLRNMFVVSDQILARTDSMPVFRPAGATNRMALDWKVKLGMNTSYEEADVMKYRNSEGPKVPQLGFISCSIRPDENTLGKKAMSPDQLVETKKTWLNLFGWSDADNLHSLITGKHLDSGETWTWFPDDRLPGGQGVAFGFWNVDHAQTNFCWDYRDCRNPNIGARLVKFFPFKKP